MIELRFTVQFHGPFAVSTGIAQEGMDTTIDQSNPLPSSAIKGLLKAQLRDTLGATEAQVAGIFHGGDQTRWVFSDALVDIEQGLWTRVKVDDDGRAEERQLMVGQQAYADRGAFTIIWDGAGGAPADEVLALRAAARCVTSLGSHRRRGLGWVSISDEANWTVDDTRRLRDWLGSGVDA